MKESTHLITGPLQQDFIAQTLISHQTLKNIGAHSLFLGSVRQDQKDGKTVTGIEYSAYEEMVAVAVQEIKDQLFDKYPDLVCLHIYHGTGLIQTGEISLFVLVSSPHRKQAIHACEECVELIKEKLPVWKKEIYSDGSHAWLKN